MAAAASKTAGHRVGHPPTVVLLVGEDEEGRRENRAFCSRNSEERESWNKNEENPHYSLFIGAPRSRAHGCTTCCVPSLLLAFWSRSKDPWCHDPWSDISCLIYLTAAINSVLTYPTHLNKPTHLFPWTEPVFNPGPSAPLCVFQLQFILFYLLHTPLTACTPLASQFLPFSCILNFLCILLSFMLLFITIHMFISTSYFFLLASI